MNNEAAKTITWEERRAAEAEMKASFRKLYEDDTLVEIGIEIKRHEAMDRAGDFGKGKATFGTRAHSEERRYWALKDLFNDRVFAETGEWKSVNAVIMNTPEYQRYYEAERRKMKERAKVRNAERRERALQAADSVKVEEVAPAAPVSVQIKMNGRDVIKTTYPNGNVSFADVPRKVCGCDYPVPTENNPEPEAAECLFGFCCRPAI